MTIPIWPEDLPRPLRSGWSQALPDGRQATRPEAGLPRVRRRFSAAVSTIQMTIDVSADGRARFWRWWSEDTASGSLPWWIPDWTLDGLGIASSEGSPLTDGSDPEASDGGAAIVISAWIPVMFATEQPPSETPIGVRWRITFQLSVLP